jgi:hypothetical protein
MKKIVVVKKSVTYIPSFTNYENPKRHGGKSGGTTRENQKPKKRDPENTGCRAKTNAHTFCHVSSFRRIPASDFHKMSARTDGLTHVLNSLQKATNSISESPLKNVLNLRPFYKNYFFQLMQVRVN